MAREGARRRVRTTADAWGDYRRVWAAHSTSTFGDQLTLIALPLAAFIRTDSAFAVGVVSSMEAVTAVAFGVVAGALADRLPHRRVLLLTDLARAVALGGLAAVVVVDGYPVWALYAGAAVLGALRVLHDAAASAVLPLLVEGPDLLRANGEMNASEAAANAAGPAIAGGLIALGGAGLALAADAVSFAASGAVVGRVRRLDTDADRHEPHPAAALWADITGGVRALAADRWMLWALSMAMAMNVVAVAVEGQFIPYAKDVLDVGALGIGAYWALGGTAAVATSLVAGRYQTARGDVVVAGLALFSAGVFVAGMVPALWSAALAYVCVGVGSALVITHVASLRQRRFPVRMQGRVSMAARTAMLLLVPPAHIGGGALASAAGSEALFVATASLGLVAAAAGVAGGLLRLRSP
jgi:MFS family permease